MSPYVRVVHYNGILNYRVGTNENNKQISKGWFALGL